MALRSRQATARRVSPAPAFDLQQRPIVERRRAAVDDREGASLERQPGDRPDLERRADDEHERGCSRERGRRSIASAGRSSPNMTTPGLSTSPHSAQSGTARRRAARSTARSARVSPHDGQTASRSEPWTSITSLAAGPLVQAVDVLRHDGRTSPRRSSSAIAWWPAFGSTSPRTPSRRRVELPDAPGIAPERVDRRDFHRVVPRPHPGGERKSGIPASVLDRPRR